MGGCTDVGTTKYIWKDNESFRPKDLGLIDNDEDKGGGSCEIQSVMYARWTCI